MIEKKSSGGSTSVTTTTTTVVETRIETISPKEKPPPSEKSFEQKVFERVAFAVITGGLLS